MLRLLADENMKTQLVRGLLRKDPSIDILRVQDVGLRSKPDAIILEWAAREGRLSITYDANTVPAEAHERVQTGKPMPGVIVIPWAVAAGQIIDDILLLAQASEQGEWEGQVIYLPL